MSSMGQPRRPMLGAAMAGLGGLACAAFVRPARAADGSLEQVLQSRRLRVGLDFDNTPLAFHTHGGEPDGLAVAVAQLLAQGLDLRPDIVAVGKSEAIAALQDGRLDLLVSAPPLGIALAREVMFADPYAYASHMVVGRRALALPRMADLAGFRIASLPGYWASAMQQALQGIQITPVAVNDAAMAERALALGDADAAIVPDYLARQMMAQRPDLEAEFELGTFWIAPALRYGQHDLLRAVNALLYLARQDGRLAILHRGFLGRPLARVPFY